MSRKPLPPHVATLDVARVPGTRLFIGGDAIHDPELWKRFSGRFGGIVRVQDLQRDGGPPCGPRGRPSGGAPAPRQSHVPLEDREDLDAAAVAATLRRACDVVDELIAGGHVPVLVHCGAGQNRSAAVVVAHLMTRRRGRRLRFAEAVALVERANERREARTLTNALFRRVCLGLEAVGERGRGRTATATARSARKRRRPSPCVPDDAGGAGAVRQRARPRGRAGGVPSPQSSSPRPLSPGG